jgi:UDP-N-acetylglucosamine:LPS N-acetylglucosamine transferase
MVAAGAAVMMEEPGLAETGKLVATLTGLLRDRERLETMGAAARLQAHPDAAERIADRLVELARLAG